MSKTEITKEQIEQWKAKHGDIFKLSIEDKTAYLKKPSRKALSYASAVGATDNLKFNEILLNECWIAGDEEIKTDDSLFLSASTQLSTLVEIKEAILVKL